MICPRGETKTDNCRRRRNWLNFRDAIILGWCHVWFNCQRVDRSALIDSSSSQGYTCAMLILQHHSRPHWTQKFLILFLPLLYTANTTRSEWPLNSFSRRIVFILNRSSNPSTISARHMACWVCWVWDSLGLRLHDSYSHLLYIQDGVRSIFPQLFTIWATSEVCSDIF